ncbi:MAG: glucokinase [Gammaproteobacteria bacterium]
MYDYLVADIGGTNARCARAVIDNSRHIAQLHDTRVYRCEELPSVDAMLLRYRSDTHAHLPNTVCLAVAGPVNGDRVTLTNNDWNFSVEQLRRRHAFARLAVINDLEAAAHATRYVLDEEILPIKVGERQRTAPRVVIGAGTGLGIAALVHRKDRWHAIASEAGHSAFAPACDDDVALLRSLRRNHAYVSWEMILSGPGIARIYRALADIAGVAPSKLNSHQILRRAAEKSDPLSEQTVTTFCRSLARFADHAVLYFGAVGGVFFAGDIFRGLQPWLASGAFLDVFGKRGTLHDMVDATGVSLILAEQPGLIGAAASAHCSEPVSGRATTLASASPNSN